MLVLSKGNLATVWTELVQVEEKRILITVVLLLSYCYSVFLITCHKLSGFPNFQPGLWQDKFSSKTNNYLLGIYDEEEISEHR